ncbi:uncharacterized protein LOC116433091 isoform X2 [Nomia melanderi]|uniref:uncharacterized protein LOC116433091 isoform X2 n=1 Tax=Nomia melanderi TaxID=2448451 RepID=UPI003FCEC0C7
MLRKTAFPSMIRRSVPAVFLQFKILLGISNKLEKGSINLKVTIMSLVLRYNESFYDIIWQCFIKLLEVMPSVLKFITATGTVAVTSYAFYRVYARPFKKFKHDVKHNKTIGLEEIRNYNRSVIRQRSIISHKELFHKLEYAADNCYDKVCALKCIDISVYCPQLLNVKSSVNGLTPFHRVCYNGHACLITFMLGKGADPFITTVAGENALCMAVHYYLNNPSNNDFSCLTMLQETGCKFGIKNKWYKILLKMAVHKNHTKLIQWLILNQEAPLRKISRCCSSPPIINNYKLH